MSPLSTVSNPHGMFDRAFPLEKVAITEDTYNCYLRSSSTSSSLHYTIRAFILFFIGFSFALINDQLDAQHNITQYPDPVTRLMVSTRTSVLSGFLAVLLGTAYSWLDTYYSKSTHMFYDDWSNAIRSLGGFLGVNLAASKLSLSNTMELAGILALIAVGLWFFFDRTVHGFGIAFLSTVVGTLFIYAQVHYGVYHFTNPDFYGFRAAAPCLIYSSCICFGTLGRQIAIIPKEWYMDHTRE
ncbi:hypothetical protein K7432_017736 [Basidiobolus ranarum]|uniref:INSIG-domain-containing protein n=1 Tax=Basidiobolus ranarum TaxID=34480 RepID=A0ABR2WD01_9FUNG